MHVFALGALDLHSAEAFPELVATSPRAEAVAVHLHVEGARAWSPAPDGAVRLGAADAPGGTLHVRCQASGIEVWLAQDACVEIRGLVPATQRVEVEVHPTPALATPTLRHLLLDQILPRIAFHLGACAVHAGGAVLDGHAIAVLGPSGAGKSTFVGACLAAGGLVLCDDTLLLEHDAGRWVAKAWYPSLRLGESSRAAVVPQGRRGEPIREPGAKHRLILAPGTSAAAAPLGMLLTLERGRTSRRELERLSTTEGVNALVRGMLRLLPNDRARGVQEIEQVSALLGRQGVWRLRLPDDLGALREAVHHVRAHLATIGPAS